MLAVGALAIVDAETANRLITSKHAEAVAPEPERTWIYTSCLKCGSALAYVANPAPHERWTQCTNPNCRNGWLR
jgi:hypothetical protein